jgi:hypothetical protein
MRAADLGWRPRIKRPADPRQGELFAGKATQLVINVVSWRDPAALLGMRQQPERSRPVLRVIEGGRTDLIADIKQLAEELRGIERRLASAHEEVGRLLALLGRC